MDKTKTWLVRCIASALSLIPVGQLLMIGTGSALTSTAVIITVPNKANADSTVSFHQLGIEKAEGGDYDGAISDFTKAIAINPKYSKPYNNRGNAKSALNDKSGACGDYKKAISLGNQGTMQWLSTKGGAWCRNMR